MYPFKITIGTLHFKSEFRYESPQEVLVNLNCAHQIIIVFQNQSAMSIIDIIDPDMTIVKQFKPEI